MKINTTHKAIFFVIPVALLLASCGKKTAEGTAPGATTSVSYNTTPPSSGSNGNNGNNGNTGTTNSCNHPIVAYTTPFTYGLSGNGQAVKETQRGVVRADQDLRVQIIPGSAIKNLSNNGTMQYSKLAVDVTLMRNGVAVPGATVRIPSATSQSGLRPGLAVGSKSQIVDFSSFLVSGDNTYSIKVSGVMTNYACNNYCTENYYWNQCLAQYGYSTCYYNYYTLVTSMVSSCQQLQCEVGAASSEAGWSLTAFIETDNTPCLTQ